MREDDDEQYLNQRWAKDNSFRNKIHLQICVLLLLICISFFIEKESLEQVYFCKFCQILQTFL